MENMTEYQNYWSGTNNPLLRRLYESIHYVSVFNTRYLLDNSSVDLTGKNGRIALSIACNIPDESYKARLNILSWLLREGCDFNLCDKHGLTLISWVCKHHKVKMFNFLIKNYKMEIEYGILDHNQDCTLMHAVRTKDLDVVKLLVNTLIQFGINVDMRNKFGLTPYAEAVRLNLVSISEFLRQTGNASAGVAIEPIIGPLSVDPGHTFRNIINMSVQHKKIHHKKKSKRKKDRQGMLGESSSLSRRENSDKNTQKDIETKESDQKEREKDATELQQIEETCPKFEDQPRIPLQKRRSSLGRINNKIPYRKRVGSSHSIVVNQSELANSTERITILQNKLESLMLYKPIIREGSKQVTYEDLREIFVNNREIGSNSTSFYDLSWLLVLKEDQEKDTFLKGTPLARPDSVDRIQSTSQNGRVSKNRKSSVSESGYIQYGDDGRPKTLIKRKTSLGMNRLPLSTTT
ncbi:uncharacterized protein LOC130662843 [Hydractinia symbiolongicarpus]|uniref:uncharacterized protein LOC130662843 n=1 Tax=Hydractinia symbiolongicarpus TaxID=13093 RepID=UPI00255049F0|nr:uncharacterized protein LOC130662843 [Hydractinia symbiolongicarpus]